MNSDYNRLKRKILLFLIVMVGFFVVGQSVQAYQIEDLPDTKVSGDIVLGPTKIEVNVDPGETTTEEMIVTNRTGRTINFNVQIEDFMGSRDPSQSIIFTGSVKGPYSLRDWLKPELQSFTLKHGQRIHLPIEILIPKNADPGGHYGAVFAAAQPEAPTSTTAQEKAGGQVAIISRVGVLLFVRVNGAVKEDGSLKDFKVEKNFYEKGPISFQLLFENNGSVHLEPYGMVEISNILGRKIDEIQLDPWFVMPDSLRLREVTLAKPFLFGKYTALALVNRGYQNVIDRKSVSFWVIPWKLVLGGLVILFLVIWFIIWIFSHFEIKKRTPG